MTSLIQVPDAVSKEEAADFFDSVGLSDLIPLSERVNSDVNKMIHTEPYPPDLLDLYRIYQYVRLNKRLTVLEFGCGWSTLIIAHALENNRLQFSEYAKELRRQNLFEVHSVDNENHFLDVAKARLEDRGLENANFSFAEVEMAVFNGRLSNQYKTLPQISPDFIYLDGPDQFQVKGAVSGLNIGHKDFMPMSSDILLIEHFLIPGTMILVDGRTANARFLRANLQRDWSYTFHETFDQSLFVLEEEPLGKINQRQLEFYSR